MYHILYIQHTKSRYYQLVFCRGEEEILDEKPKPTESETMTESLTVIHKSRSCEGCLSWKIHAGWNPVPSGGRPLVHSVQLFSWPTNPISSQQSSTNTLNVSNQPRYNIGQLAVVFVVSGRVATGVMGLCGIVSWTICSGLYRSRWIIYYSIPPTALKCVG